MEPWVQFPSGHSSTSLKLQNSSGEHWRTGTQSHPWLRGKSEASLSYLSPRLKKIETLSIGSKSKASYLLSHCSSFVYGVMCVYIGACVWERGGEEEEEEEQQRRGRLERKKLSVQPWILNTQRLYKLLRTISSLCRNETTLKRPLCLSICRTVDTNGPKEMGIYSQESHTGRRKRHLPKGEFVSWKEILQGLHILSDHLPGWDRSLASIPDGPVIGRSSDPVIGRTTSWPGLLRCPWLSVKLWSLIKTWRQTYEVCWISSSLFPMWPLNKPPFYAFHF